MSKVTSKLQLSIPKALADQLGLRPGDEVRWVAEGRSLRLLPGQSAPSLPTDERLRLFDDATARQHGRQRGRRLTRPTERGWTREDLYRRGRAR
jgi:AbrB family looped-hinge helix DNA binding protein